MGEHDPRLRHHAIDGSSLRTPLHALPPIIILHRTIELGRMAGRALDKYTRHVSESSPINSFRDLYLIILVDSSMRS